MGRPGLLGTMARTAVVASTVSAVAAGASRRATRETAGQEPPAAHRPREPATTQVKAASDDRLARLRELGELRSSGVLTDDEFATEKARILST
jgi:hypothetical protein